MAVAYAASSTQLSAYKSNSLLGLGPGQLVVKLYDMALVDLKGKDAPHACKVLSELIDSLDFRQEGVPVGLFRLYRYCMEEIKKGEFEVPTRIVSDLRETWVQALAKAAGQAP
ncbi:MAG: hypothetical protein M0Z94_05405 [Dehalococcoidales bacterium]|nr:hypothetical protein [Dehalococcoidales bacterium]